MPDRDANQSGTERTDIAPSDARTGPSRRSFLKGAGLAASSSALFGGSAVARLGEVPDEPDQGGQVRHFDVHAIDVDIVYNAAGQHQPNGVMYVLEENREAARRASGCTPGEADVDTSVIEPLVIRANQGDIVEIEFHNDLDRQASMHQFGLPYEVNESDGMAVGYNDDTTVPPGESITYRWYADNQGTHFFSDNANPAIFSDPEERFDDNNLHTRGLFGAIVVESPDADWRDPETGEELRSGTKAGIIEPDGVSHREFIVCYHDSIDIVNADGSEPTWPGTDTPQSIHALNYRAEPTSARLSGQTGVEEESTFYSSWVHGDPGGGDTVFPCYTGDPVKMVAVGAQVEENHVHHLHGHRWKSIPEETESDTIDSQTIAPATTQEARLTIAHGPGSISPDTEFDEAFEVGAGNGENTGDYLLHCHMFPHYGEGMNAIMRVLDKEQEELQTLPNSDPPLDADSEIAGFPEFIPGEDGELPPKPPNSELPTGRDPTPEEAEALGESVPGAPYNDPSDPEGYDPEVLGETREYSIVALPADVVYNDDGDHDPEGKVYVLEEDAEAVRNGEMNPEPLVIRANVGDCVEITLKNELELPKAVHPHFVDFDPLGSDSAIVGYNYDQGTEPGEEMQYRWFANEEGTIFFHDHITGIPEVQNGLFGAIIVEPADSTWHDPHTGEEIESGTQAIIDPADEPAFREFTLLYHDFVPLRNRDDEFINQQVEHNQNAGSGAINYRTAPYFRRNDEGDDPAYVHSSRLHGDPPTPTLEAYSGDPIRLRVLQGPYEEQHNFGIHGLRGQPDGLRRAKTTSQIIGPSEAFTFELLEEDTTIDDLPNPDGLPIWDHVYGSEIVQDLWEGMWGISACSEARSTISRRFRIETPPVGRSAERSSRRWAIPLRSRSGPNGATKTSCCTMRTTAGVTRRTRTNGRTTTLVSARRRPSIQVSPVPRGRPHGRTMSLRSRPKSSTTTTAITTPTVSSSCSTRRSRRCRTARTPNR